MKTASILKDVTYHPKKPVINVLFETSFTKEIRIAMQKGTLMKDHKTAFPIVVEVVEGEINFGVEGELLSMKKGDLIALKGNITHNLQANMNSIIRLTLTKNDKTDRVKEIVEHS